nr:HEPN domain-containing protein [uncultured Brevundimonas sp.]
MTTALFELATSLPGRLNELDRLVDHARRLESANEPLYNSLCRATSVLLASHLEGFLKGITSGLIDDLNDRLGDFSNMPSVMQRTFCERIAHFEGVPEKEVKQRVRQLTEFFKRNSVPIDMKAFTYKENFNKNPTSAVIDAAMEKVGVPNIVSAMSGGIFDIVFNNDNNATWLLRRKLKSLRSTLHAYPYRRLPCEFEFEFRRTEANSTLWHAFIDDIMTRRHSVAHGDTLENDTDALSLQRDIIKLEVLMHGLLYAAATYVAAPRAS